MHRLLNGLIVLLCLSIMIGCLKQSVPTSKEAESKPRITVMNFENQHSQPEMQDVENRIASNLQDQLQQSKRFVVIAQKQLNIESNKPVKGVDFLVSGTVSGDSMSTEVIVNFVSSSTHKIEKSFRAKGITTQSIIPIISKLMSQIEIAFPLAGEVAKVEAQPETETAMPSEQVIAILPFVNHSQEKADWLGRTISDTLSTELSTLKNFHLAERQRLDKILEEQKLMSSELFDPASVIEPGRLWKERYIISGGYQKLGDKYRIDARRLDVQTSEIFEAEGLIASESDLFETLQSLGKQLRESIDRGAKRPGKESQIEGIMVDENHLEEVPISVYHLFQTIHACLVEYSLENKTNDSQRLIITTQIQGYSNPQNETVDIQSGEVKTIRHTPAFLAEKFPMLLQAQEAGLEMKISSLVNGSELLIYQQTPTIRLLPRDTLLWRLNTPDNQSITLLPAVAAWVSPDSPIVAQILREATEYSSSKGIFGYQSGSLLTGKPAGVSADEKKAIIRDQIKAVYQVLQNKYQIRYVDQSTQYPAGKGQRILHPSDVLNYKSANCIDGVVLFASLLYRAGINPIIAIVPGHAFLGWRVWDNVDDFEFLETTKLGVSDFETALNAGNEEAKRAFAIDQFQKLSFDSKGQLKIGEAILLDVKTLKERGKLSEMPVRL